MSSFNAASWLLEGREGVAIRTRDGAIDYATLRDRVARTAGGLRDLGVEPEQRVVLVMRDGADLVATFLGAMWLGAIPVPVNPLLPERDIAPIASDAGAKLTLTQAPPLGTPVDPAATTADSPGFWLCTSGTTGTPKLAMHRHADARTVAEGYAREILGITADDICFSVGPMFHAYGLGNSLFFPFAASASAILEPTRPPTAALVGEIVATMRPTLFFAVPTFYSALLASDLPADSFSSVRHAVSAAESLPADIHVRFQERFGVEILDGLGSTEMTHIYLSNRPGRCKPGTSGTPVGGYDVRIDADDGVLWVRGDSMATGYWCRTDASRRTFVGEWMRTGDIYHCDDDGAYTYQGRADDMFKVSGEWVSPAEVEAALIAFDGVREAAVVGCADDEGLTRCVAFVVATSVGEDDLVAHCKERLAGFKRPRRYEFVDELPKTATGKIKRYLLREGASA